MSCTRELLGFRWERHLWRARVGTVEHRRTPETDMWGRVWSSEYVCCHKHQVCIECGATRSADDCNCDPEEAKQCALLLESVGATHDVSA